MLIDLFMCIREIFVSLNKDVKLFLPHIFPHMVTPTMFPWDKNPEDKKSLIQKCSNSLIAHKLSHDCWFWFFFCAYGSLPDAAIWWCLWTGGGGVVTSDIRTLVCTQRQYWPTQPARSKWLNMKLLHLGFQRCIALKWSAEFDLIAAYWIIVSWLMSLFASFR